MASGWALRYTLARPRAFVISLSLYLALYPASPAECPLCVLGKTP